MKLSYSPFYREPHAYYRVVRNMAKARAKMLRSTGITDFIEKGKVISLGRGGLACAQILAYDLDAGVAIVDKPTFELHPAEITSLIFRFILKKPVYNPYLGFPSKIGNCIVLTDDIVESQETLNHFLNSHNLQVLEEASVNFILFLTACKRRVSKKVFEPENIESPIKLYKSYGERITHYSYILFPWEKGYFKEVE